MATVVLQDIRKNFGALTTIHGVSIDIDDGAFVVLVGPSGCGKSTLLRMIAGLEDVTAGTISIDDKVVNVLPPKDRDIAMVFQNYALYPHLTVYKNMSFALRLQRTPTEEIDRRVRDAAAILGISELLDRYPRQLSGGQRQRVAMGRAIVRDPKVFLFDEPLSNLDAKLRVSMRSEIKALHQRLRPTTIYVTHDQVEAMTMADTIVVMRAGRVEQVGAPLDLYDKPANIFVASFIGSPSMNLIPGTLLADGRFAVDGMTGETIRLPPPSDAAGSRAVHLGVRPEHVRVDEAGLPLRIRTVEPMGSEVMVNAELGQHAFVCLFRERLRLQPDEILRVGFAPDALHVFDRETGLRVEPSAAVSVN